MMQRGFVKRLVLDRGFGFLANEAGQEYFFHRTGMVHGTFENLREGIQVTFEEEGVAERAAGGVGVCGLTDMSRPRKPKNLANYETVDAAAKGLHRLADDLVKRALPGDLMTWTINLHFWNQDWERPAPPRNGKARS